MHIPWLLVGSFHDSDKSSIGQRQVCTGPCILNAFAILPQILSNLDHKLHESFLGVKQELPECKLTSKGLVDPNNLTSA